MEVADYAACDATELRRLITSKQVTKGEVLRAAKEAIAQVGPQLNAIAFGPFDDGAADEPRTEEAPIGTPFGGVPIAVKDTLFERGRPMTLGSRLLEGFVSPVDTTVAARLRNAGLTSLVRTATPEFGLNIDTAPVASGPVANPWSSERSPGGSSGGSAALVAARAVPIAHGNDGGGSIRLPAGWCGLVGLKPTRGRVPVGPVVAEIGGGHGAEFVLTRTVRDAAAMLDVLNGPAPGDRYYVARPSCPYVEEIGADPGHLRVAIHTASFSNVPTQPDVAAAVERVGLELERLGHHVDEAVAAVPWDALHAAHVTIWSTFLASTASTFAQLLRREIGKDTVEAASLACIRHGQGVTALELAQAMATVNQLGREWGAFLDRYDLFLCPTAVSAAPDSGVFDQNAPRYDSAKAWIDDVFEQIPFTPIANATGQPAISLPLGMSGDGMPIGVMLTAQSLREDLLFRVAGQLEAACPWDQRRPSVAAGH